MVWLYGADAGKIAVVPCGVDLNIFQPLPQEEAKRVLGLPDRRRIILYVGRIEPLKGIDTLIRAMAVVVPACPDWRENLSVVIIGGAPGAGADQSNAELARLDRLRAELGIEDLVTFLGSKDQDALPDYYAAAEMVIMPSHYESFGLVALEAMAMGTPVIASEVGGLAFLVQDGHTGYHVPSRDPAALADRMDFLLKNKDCRDMLGEQARRYAEQYAWSHIVERMIVLYEDLLRSAAARALQTA